MTEGDLSDKLGQILSDPAKMAQIAALAKGFAAPSGGASEPFFPGTPPPSSPPPCPPPRSERPLSFLPPEVWRELTGHSRERMELLRAVRPFLEPPRREKLDRVLSLLKTLDLLALMQP